MALVLKDRVKETTTTTGTGSFALAGAVTGYDSFGQIGNGNTTYYAVYLDGGSEWEVGIGTYTSPSTLSRDTILASSNAGNIVTFSAGQKTIWCDYPAGKAVYTDAAGSISQPIVNISGITGAISTVDTITFDTGYTTTLTTGQLGWDGNNTLGVGMSGGNIVQEIGLQTYIYGKATSAITKGQLIKKTGANGSSGVITFAPTTANMTNSTDIIGIAAENIALNGFGYIMSTGNLRGFNTTGSSSGETWADGDTLYYNPSGNGLMTKTKPSAPNSKTEVAVVTNAGSGGSGSVVVEIIHGSVLGGTDSNVQITSPTGGQLLSYDQTNSYWKNTNLAAGTGISVSSATGGTITVTNSAPDQTVSIASGTGISVTGTYPSFTVTNTSPSSGGTVTNVSGTAPVSVANGTTTPTISLASGYGDTQNPYASKTANNFLAAPNGSAGVPTFRAIVAADIPTLNQNTTGTASNVTGTVAIANGGTGQTTAVAAFNALNPMTTTGDIIYEASPTTAARLGIGTTGQVLTVSGGLPVWSTPSAGTPAGSNTQIQYNNSGAFGASSALTFASSTLTAPNVVASNGLFVNNATVGASYSIASGYNAMSVGPVTVASGQSVTVPSGSRWVVL